MDKNSFHDYMNKLPEPMKQSDILHVTNKYVEKVIEPLNIKINVLEEKAVKI